MEANTAIHVVNSIKRDHEQRTVTTKAYSVYAFIELFKNLFHIISEVRDYSLL